MMTDDDKRIEDFFARYQPGIPDDGFSKRVMNKLPMPIEHKNRLWVAFCWLAGVVLFLVFNGVSAVRHVLLMLGEELWLLVRSISVAPTSLFFYFAAFAVLSLVTAYNVVMEERGRG